MSTFEIRRWKAFAIIDGILFFGLLAITARQATDPDLWWHLRTGQWIVEHRQVPHTDPFSFTRNGSPWVSHEWLSELLFFELWRSAGSIGLILFSSIVTSIGFMLLFRRCAAPPHWAAAITVLGALASAPTWGVRPQMFTFALASLWLWLLDRSEGRPWLLGSLPPIFLLWLNLHGGFALGPALLIAYGIGLVWETMAGDTEWQVVRPQVLRLLLMLGVCMAIVPLNPSGTQLYGYPLETLRSDNMRAFISEWHSPDFHQLSYMPTLLMGVALFLVFALSSFRLRARTLLPLLAAFLAALDAVRHIPIFVLLAVPVIATTFQRRRLSATLPRRSKPMHFKFAAAVLVVLLMALFAGAEWAKLARDQEASEARIYPLKAVEQLASVSERDRVFAYYDWGGYVIWKLYPSSKVFVDGRADLYAPDVLHQFQGVMQLRPEWHRVIDSWDVTAVLVPSSSALAEGLALNPIWRLQYQDSTSTLFVRKRNTSRTPEMHASFSGGLADHPENLLKSEKIFSRPDLNLRN